MRIFILCAGDATRWQDDTSKHLVKIVGEPLLHRTIRLIGEHAPDAQVRIVLADPKDPAYEVRGARRVKARLDPNHGDAGKFLSSLHLWDDTERTVVIFGDVWWSRDTLEHLLAYEGDWQAVLRMGPGGCGGEIFGFTFGPGMVEPVRAAATTVAATDQRGGWGVYRVLDRSRPCRPCRSRARHRHPAGSGRPVDRRLRFPSPMGPLVLEVRQDRRAPEAGVNALVCASPVRTGPRKGESATGTRTGYTRHRRAGEPACEACSSAAQIYRASSYSANRDVEREQHAQWVRSNRPLVREIKTRWRLAHPERVAEIQRRYTAQSLHRKRVTRRAWNDANREAVREMDRRRRARLAAALTVPFTAAELEQKMAYWGNRCWMCQEAPYEEVDHVIALARGGPHMLANLRPACASCNRSKHTRDWRELVAA